MAKIIFVLGGVYSSCGKGISAASISLLMKSRGHKVTYIKFDPYHNLNSGVIRPSDHGETYVTSGSSSVETDLDLGNVERIANIEMSQKNICTSGTLFKELLEEDENGVYLGQTLQTSPHLTNKIRKRLEDLGKDVDIVVAEIGGTCADIESNMFLEAIREMKLKYERDCIVVLVAPVIFVPTVSEFKTKPLQRSVRDIYSFGFVVDILLCRSEKEMPDKIIDKISRQTGISKDCIIQAVDVDTIYRVPIEFYNKGVDDIITDKLRLKRNPCRIHQYRQLVEEYANDQNMASITIGMICKYDIKEAYLSVKESLYHAGVRNKIKVNIKWINTTEIEKAKDISGIFSDVHGVIVPGGFDSRGVEQKISAIQYARENNVPFLGICLGLQCAVIEFARNVCKLPKANSYEFDKNTPNPVIHYVDGQENINKKSGTMRLGSYECELTKDSLVYEIYGKKMISERHRHRCEVNDEFADVFEKHGLKISGRNPDSNLIEMMELDRKICDFFVGTQAHPEFQSKLIEPAPLFGGLVIAAKNYHKKQ